MSMVTPRQPNEGLKIVEDATCTFCGCLCDDITLEVEGNRITEARNACTLGETWFYEDRREPDAVCLIDGEPGALEDGIERAARILAEAKYPLVHGLCHTTDSGAARRRIDRRFDRRLRRYVE